MLRAHPGSGRLRPERSSEGTMPCAEGGVTRNCHAGPKRRGRAWPQTRRKSGEIGKCWHRAQSRQRVRTRV